MTDFPNPQEIARDGFVIVPDVVSEAGISALLAGLEHAASEGKRRRGEVYAMRNLLHAVPEAREWAQSEPVRDLVTPLLGDGAFAVRGILFDKTPGANWKVLWHQDLSIAVRERRDTDGFGPWSEKAGVVHVQPPAALLARMLTVRLHLDECDTENGPVRVLPGSHTSGRLSSAQIAEWRQQTPEITCTVPRGGALVMRPLLLHASSDAKTPRHRRVVHLEFASEELPGALDWKEKI
jgi:ectoine hydroxylase-related dioxygenase (phytanoyl-CoA dioxygenase family)